MDFTRYSNINNVVNRFGGVKQTMLNKSLYENAEKSWERFSEADLQQIDSEINSSVQVYKTIVTTKALLIYNMHTFLAIPVNDILWIYNRIVVAKMNFIPYNKTHYLKVFTKDGETYDIGQKNTGGFSKKMPNDEVMAQIRSVLDKVRRGIVYGADDEMYMLCTQNLPGAIARVEENSK